MLPETVIFPLSFFARESIFTRTCNTRYVNYVLSDFCDHVVELDQFTRLHFECSKVQ
jgi:hypothetical protein